MELPCGSKRWTRPATMPLSDEQWKDLENGIIPEDVAPWHEISDEQLGWKAVRMIGHRGCGKTPACYSVNVTQCLFFAMYFGR